MRLDNIKRIKRKFKRNTTIFELKMINYSDINLYVRLDYIRRYGAYKLYWFELENNKMNINKCKSELYLTNDKVETFIDFFKNNLVNYDDSVDSNDNLVEFSSPYPSLNDSYTHIKFHDYIPSSSLGLQTLLHYIIELLPSYYDYLKYQLDAKINGYEHKFEYQKSFEFDLYNDSLDKVFSDVTIKRGEDYYKDGRVLYLELIDERYFAVVKGEDNYYLVVVKYIEDTKRLQLYCDCSCEFFCKHMYAVIKSIRDKKLKSFYKLTPINDNDSYLDELLNFNYYLCAGLTSDNKLIIVSHDGGIVYSDIYDIDGTRIWKVIADFDDELAIAMENVEYIPVKLDYDFNDQELDLIRELDLPFEVNRAMSLNEIELLIRKLDDYNIIKNNIEDKELVDSIINKMSKLDENGDYILDIFKR